MKKTLLLGLFLAQALTFNGFSQTQRNCGTMIHLEHQKQNDPDIESKMRAIEAHTNSVLENASKNRTAATIITIPVVVHVVYNTASENLTDAQIQSQITVLNEDFRKMNADANKVPSLFSGLASDIEIQFCLAKTDPNGNPTTGITRTSTSVTAFGTDDKMKSSSTGGKSPWNTAQYLNMWSCDISGGILGYAQFPGGSASTDGVVIDYAYFGRGGSAVAPFDKGRTATHEVGHWLNLRHIWGDANCGNDYVADTPTQQTANNGCPSFPRSTCNNTSDMFMNYMDYTDDACMYMFSTGQKERMRALFVSGGARASLLTSNGCNTSSGTTCATPSGLFASNVTSSSATLNWAAVSSASSYNIRAKATSSTSWTSYTSSSTSLSISGLTAGSTYEFQVQAVCSGTTSAFSSSARFTATSSIVTYCNSKGNSVADEWIGSVRLNTISNASGRNAGYANFTNLSTDLRAGTSYTISLTPGFASTKYREGWRVWIDWNGDGDFTDSGELEYYSSITSSSVSGSITVPSNARLGKTRMRVSMKYNALPSSCETFSYGEVEDYSINVVSSASRVGTVASIVDVYPNPASDKATITVSLPSESSKLQLKVIDIQGKEHYTEKWNNTNGLFEYELNTSTFKAGIYLIIIESDNLREVKKLSVIK